MKKIILIVLFCFPMLIFANGKFKAGVKSTYEENAFNLSDSDLNKFDNGNKEFKWAETSDDFIQRFYARIENTFKIAKKLKLTPYGGSFYDKYYSNDEKTKAGGYAGLRTAYKNLSLSLSYGYYPDNYTRNYEDHDATGLFEQYKWDKNTYRASGFIGITKHDFLLFSVTADDYFYNEFFTEYDGRQMAYELGYKRSFSNFYLKAGYIFKDFKLENDVPSNAEELDFVRDAKYECNEYYLSIRSKKIKINKKLWYRPFCGYTMEQKFWTTDLGKHIDPIHSGRDDISNSFNFGVEFKLIKNMLITAKYSHQQRKTDAAWENLSDIKDYSDNKLSLDFEYNLNF